MTRTFAEVVETIIAGEFYDDYDQSVSDLGVLREALQVEKQMGLATAHIEQARKDWLEVNDPIDGTDCVTPYDSFLYSKHKVDAKTIYILGRGEVVASAGIWSGMPCVKIASACVPGFPGENAEEERSNLETNGTVIAFVSMQAVLEWLDTIKDAIQLHQQTQE